MSINKAVGLQRNIPEVTMNARLKRIGAAFVDLLIVSCLQIWMSSVFGVVNPASGYQTDGDGIPTFFPGIASIHPVWLYIIALAYFFIQEALFSTTVGKYFFGLYVVTLRGQRLTLQTAFIRNILRFVDAFPFFYIVGMISGMLSPTFQRVGDRAAHTTVVPMVLVPHAVYSRMAFVRRYLALIFVVLLGVAFCVQYTYFDRPPLAVSGWMNVNNVVVESANNVTVASGGKVAAVPACGQLQLVNGDYIVDRTIMITHIGSPQWIDSNTVVYPVQYVGQSLCSASITLRWHGFLDGNWQVEHVTLHS